MGFYGDFRFNENENRFIVEATRNYKKVSGRFSWSIFESCFYYHGKGPPLYHI